MAASRFRCLTPGAYDVRAELSGFKALEQKGVNVPLEQTASVNLRMEIGGLTEIVEVIAASPVVDTRPTTIGAVLDTPPWPVSRSAAGSATRCIWHPASAARGTPGTANPRFPAARGLENQYVVDGANVTNTGYGGLGSYSIIFGSLGNATPYDFIKEIQVKTGGYEAEFGQATGGVVNVITKSGTNMFTRLDVRLFAARSLQGDCKQFQAPNGR